MSRQPGRAATAVAALARPLIVLTGAAAIAVVVGTALATPAHAATSYRYWAYYVASGTSWQYSQRGPAFEHPQDGEVQGWRFAVQSRDAQQLAPRHQPDFATLCARTPAQSGQVRVGIVIDFGIASDAPPGEQPPGNVFAGCVRVASGSSGLDVLDAAVGTANVRIGTGRDAGLVCGISGYPKAECAVATVGASAAPRTLTAPPSATAQPTATTQPTVTRPRTPPPPRTTDPAVTSPAGSAVATSPTGSAVATSAGESAPVTSAGASAAPAASNLAELPQHSGGGFPTGAVVGGGLAVLLVGAAAWRAWAARR